MQQYSSMPPSSTASMSSLSFTPTSSSAGTKSITTPIDSHSMAQPQASTASVIQSAVTPMLLQSSNPSSFEFAVQQQQQQQLHMQMQWQQLQQQQQQQIAAQQQQLQQLQQQTRQQMDQQPSSGVNKLQLTSPEFFTSGATYQSFPMNSTLGTPMYVSAGTPATMQYYTYAPMTQTSMLSTTMQPMQPQPSILNGTEVAGVKRKFSPIPDSFDRGTPRAKLEQVTPAKVTLSPVGTVPAGALRYPAPTMASVPQILVAPSVPVPTAASLGSHAQLRRYKHKEVEVRRRRKISTLFTELSDLLDCGPTDKASILSIATRFIKRAKSKGVKTHKSDLMIHSHPTNVANGVDDTEEEEEDAVPIPVARIIKPRPGTAVPKVAVATPVEQMAAAVVTSSASSASLSTPSSPKPCVVNTVNNTAANPLSLLFSASSLAAASGGKSVGSDGEKPCTVAV
jgi:hypothetical protein